GGSGGSPRHSHREPAAGVRPSLPPPQRYRPARPVSAEPCAVFVWVMRFTQKAVALRTRGGVGFLGSHFVRAAKRCEMLGPAFWSLPPLRFVAIQTKPVDYRGNVNPGRTAPAGLWRALKALRTDEGN